MYTHKDEFSFTASDIERINSNRDNVKAIVNLKKKFKM